MDYVIEKMNKIKVIGYGRNFSYEEAYKEIPKFWGDFFYKINTENKQATKDVIMNCGLGEFGISIENNDETNEFKYMIAGRYDGRDIPEGMEMLEIPSLTWAKFKSIGPLPGALQDLNSKIFKEWLPANEEYEMEQGINIEWYSCGDTSSIDYISEIWIPVKRK